MLAGLEEWAAYVRRPPRSEGPNATSRRRTSRNIRVPAPGPSLSFMVTGDATQTVQDFLDLSVFSGRVLAVSSRAGAPEVYTGNGRIRA